jgi:hypothetical protein
VTNSPAMTWDIASARLACLIHGHPWQYPWGPSRRLCARCLRRERVARSGEWVADRRILIRAFGDKSRRVAARHTVRPPPSADGRSGGDASSSAPAEWLGEVEGDHAGLLRLARDGCCVWPIDQRVGSPHNNGPELMEVIAP